MLHTVTEGIGTVYWWILDHLFLINIIFALLIIFFQRRNPPNDYDRSSLR